MKKLLFILLFFSFPFIVKADTYISNYYIDATIDKEDIHIKELFIYKGNYNGAYKELYYGTNNVENHLQIDSNLYNPEDIILNEIGEIELNQNYNFNLIYEKVNPFLLNNEASVGSKGYYSVKKDFEKYTFKIFNPGGTKAFYIDYTLKNVVVSHNDVNEIWLNIFKKVPDMIKNIEMRVHLSEENKDLRVWAHGPLTGNIEIKNSNLVYFTIPTLTNGDFFDIRLTFDNNFLSSKKSNIYALDKIIKEETKWADEANKEREEYRKYLEEQEKKLKKEALLFHFLGIIWIIGLVPLIIFVYKKYDKEHTSTFKGKYFRDIPSDIDPPLVNYLLNKKIDTNDLSAIILNLIYKKIIDFEQISKKDYKFTYINKKEEKVTEIEKKALFLLFNDTDNITLLELKKRASKKYNTFLNDYNDWYNFSLEKAMKQDYYEEKSFVRLLSCFYSILGFSLIFLKNEYVSIYLFIVIILLSLVSFIYFLIFYKRTIHGNEEYLKWIGLKNFMNDFGTMDIKELPEIRLWEKYLVYAVTLGCADKLSKMMKLKINEMNTTNNNIALDTALFDSRMYSVMKMNDVVTHSVTSAVISAKSIAASNNSSGSGYGGGFSSGGSRGGGFSGGGGGSTGHF